MFTGLGHIDYSKGNLGSAEENYKKAIAINPDNKFAYYNLGNLYEDLKQIKEAKSAYLVAIRSRELPQAYNNLGRLYILDKDYTNAAAFLSQGLEQVLSNQGVADPSEVKYTLYKNLGWLEFAQGNTDEAQEHLKEALKIAKQAQKQTGEAFNAGAANCLMAQIARMNKTPQASYHSQQCCKQASLTQPEEYEWLSQARHHLARENKECEAFSLFR